MGSYVFCDNFYTRLSLANKIKEFTDDEVCVTGTVRYNYVDKYNKPLVLTGLKALGVDNTERGCWVLVPAYNPPEELAKTILRNSILKVRVQASSCGKTVKLLYFTLTIY